LWSEASKLVNPGDGKLLRWRVPKKPGAGVAYLRSTHVGDLEPGPLKWVA
jgi:hypothetical protein